MIKKLLLKLSILFFCFCFYFVDATNAGFSDTAEIINNTFTTGSWDIDPFILVVSGSPNRKVKNQIENSGFEEGILGDYPQDWDAEEEVQVVESENITDEFGDPLASIDPVKGSYMAKIGKEEDWGNYYEYNYLSQTFPNQGKNLSFWYNFYTFDYGFDQPGMAVYLDDGLNNKQIFQMWAEDVDTDEIGGGLDSSGWQQYFYNLSSIDQTTYPELTVNFCAGNAPEGDDILQSWVYLDQINTEELVVNSSNNFNFEFEDGDSSDEDVIVYYQFGNWGDLDCTGDTYSYNDLGTLNWDEANNDMLCYWSTDGVNEELPHKTVHVVYDNTAPDQISDLSITDYGNGSFTLDWTAPDDAVAGRATEYDIRYSTAPITNDTWDSATSVSDLLLSVYDSSVDGIPAPRIAGAEESLDIGGLTPAIPYWFAVKSSDAVPNWSAMAVVETGEIIVINEFLPNPIGNDYALKPNGEWVELYNLADYEVDVAGWYLYDELDIHPLEITNLNTDTGDTIVPAKGYLVIYLNNAYTGWLNNSGGDEVRLYNDKIDVGILIDFHSYTTDAAENKSFARIPDGTNNWIDPVPTPGTPNKLEDSNNLIVEIDFYINDDSNSVSFTTSGISPYSNLEYEITYEPANRAPQGISGSIALEGQNEIAKDGLMLGTDSSGDWIWDTGMEKIYLKIILTGEGMPERTLEKEIIY